MAPKDGQRVGLSLRVTAETKRRLMANADAVGRSLSQEAEFRLEQSYVIEDLKRAIADIPKQVSLAVEHAIKRTGIARETAAKKPAAIRQDAILRLLRKEGPCNVSELANKLNRPMGDVTVACGSLIKSGAVESHSEAGRMVLSLPTPSTVS